MIDWRLVRDATTPSTIAGINPAYLGYSIAC
jgi:hypothetical protein